MTAHAVRTTIEAFANAVMAADRSGMRAFLAEDYFGHAPGPDEPSQADRWVELVTDVVSAIPDLRIGIEDISEDGELVHVRAVARGTHTGDLWGSPPTGEAIRLDVPLLLRDTGSGWVVHGDGAPVAILDALRAVGVIPAADAMHLPPQNPIRPPEFLLRLGFTGQAEDRSCSHLASARVFATTTDACGQCVSTGDVWPALRMCLVCGFAGCCDTSVNKHMRAHWEATGHPLFRSVRLAEGWIWCYEDAAFFERATLERLAAAAGART